ncbi:MAG: DinB family protein [Gemmatimonadota bacterium]
MTRLDEIRELYEFNAWATSRMFQATSLLSEDELTRDLKNSFPSIRDTLVHIVGAEWVWLTRWQGSSPTAIPNMNAAMSHAEIVRWWHEINAERDQLLRSLAPESLDRIVAYKNFAGVDFAFPLWQMLRHLVNHSSYHRGQITTMLKQLGHKPVSTDLILMYQERQKTAAQPIPQ